MCAETLDAPERRSLERYAACVGLAFQIVDDVLDSAGTTEALGKTAGKDAAHNKPNYVSALGLEGARSRARELRDEALRALEPLPAPADRLRQMADLIILRQS
jgi:farnesyl diphosphate synthase